MIGTSTREYIFIRVCVLGLYSVAPICIIYTTLSIGLYGTGVAYYRLPFLVECVALAETLFYFFVYLPYSCYLQREAVHPAPRTRAERRELFELCQENVANPEQYLSKWFLGAPRDEIKRENVKEFLLWAFFNRGGPPGEDDEELEEYVSLMERQWGERIHPGRGTAKCLRLTLDGVNMMHRSLIWYFCVGFVDSLTYFRLLYLGFHFHRTRVKSLFLNFPFRMQALTTSYTSPVKYTTYWHRPHTSKIRLPIVFIHGIGIGLYPYAEFLKELNCISDLSGDPDDQVGIIALEIMPISFRICHAPLDKDTLIAEINTILNHHGFDKFVLVSHSYGTFISTHLLKSPTISPKIAATVLVDPVSILLHLPDVAYNFTRRKPQRANEWLLYYFASMDMGVSRALSRHFFWSECALWKRNIEGKDVTVSFASRDLIVDTEIRGRYLMSASTLQNPDGNLRDLDDMGRIRNVDVDSSGSPSRDGSESDWGGSSSDGGGEKKTGCGKVVEVDDWKNRPWTGKGIDILWFEGLDHMQVFDAKDTRARLIRVIDAYSRRA